MGASKPFSPDVRERAVRLVRKHQGEYPTSWAAITSITGKIGCSGETPRGWLRRANEILRKANAFFAAAALLRGLVQRQFTAARPNQLWVADFTYVATWRGLDDVEYTTLD